MVFVGVKYAFFRFLVDSVAWQRVHCGKVFVVLRLYFGDDDVTLVFSRVMLILHVLVHVSLILICCKHQSCLFFFLDVSYLLHRHLQFACFCFSLARLLSERVTLKCLTMICCHHKFVAQCHFLVVLSPLLLIKVTREWRNVGKAAVKTGRG